MKSGMIVYITGNEPPNWVSDPGHIRKQLNVRADRIEVITKNTGHMDVSDAWLSLIRKGMQLITCRLAGFTPDGEVKLMNREIRLCG